MTSKLKCPVCQQDLGIILCDLDDFFCPGCKMWGSEKLWKALIQEKKQLDRAKWWLKEIVKNHRYTPITTAEMALKELDDEQ